MNETEKKLFIRMVEPLIDALDDPETEAQVRKMLGTLIVGFEEAGLSFEVVSKKASQKGSAFYRKLIGVMCSYRPPGESQILWAYKIVTEDEYLTAAEKIEAIHNLAFWVSLMRREREDNFIKHLPPESPLVNEIARVHAERLQHLHQAARDAMGGNKIRTGPIVISRPQGLVF